MPLNLINDNSSNINNSNSTNASVCLGCGLLIQDKFVFQVLPDTHWHEHCLKCAECDCKLNENGTCFVKNGKAYCKLDYNRSVDNKQMFSHFKRLLFELIEPLEFQQR
jgi:hypothetical protein